MSRPKHLNCVNTAEGIRRINEMQEHYDKDPEAYERREREEREENERREREEREEEEREENERRQNEEADAQAQYYRDQQGH